MKAMNTTITGMITNVYTFYSEGFKGMRLGKRLWMLIGVKLLIMFGVLKLFFFPNVLSEHFKNDAERSDFVSEQLLRHSAKSHNIQGEQPWKQ
jgi:hypothetical protein